ncbi:hypothetical protein TBLA_0A07540 [Henningerozyma blattae CBS 6284]|uniref:Phosphotransferase n=1 Tax=Henningerozyma blattae (strain ATCC 34711 / CBS 6284 / DSM 70876 / NBRC 10599 / NRRL Y-10934 / UCD 77-7) TaxID=1071380 RepID=I2GWP2_HENB6|nr:hypothetical protein TBLA_0A07540 [Tetrapisispora blattae CBS 6284]CCH58544.1 hypothetical protein TBLA_0A07540 [Tetrapisispora blattae CBS 6284]
MSFEQLHRETAAKLDDAVDKICSQLVVEKEQLKTMTEGFIEAMENGLNHPNSSEVNSSTTPSPNSAGLSMLPSFVTGLPNGTERGILLACELGTMHFRICSVELLGDHTFQLRHVKSHLPQEVIEEDTASSDKLFSFMARRTYAFIKRAHPEVLDPHAGVSMKMGFTFTYPVEQTSLNEGILIRWTKNVQIKDTVGRDVVQLFQDQLDSQGLERIRIVALTNDTVGTFLSLCYSSGSSMSSLATGEVVEPVIGCIIGTGTNGCYMESTENIGKLQPELRERLIREGKTKMCVNTEWGSFDNELKYIPTTKYDTLIDQKFSSNPGFHLFEKRISALYLGEILRNILLDLYQQGLILTQYRTERSLPHRLKTPFELGCQVLAHIEIDDSTNLRETELTLLQSLRLPTTPQERYAIQKIVRAISRRSAYLAAVPIAAILMKTGALTKRYHGEVEVGCDGSIAEYYPGYRSMLRHALALSPIGTEGERKVHLRIAKDGSGVGSALCALVA